MWIVCCVSPHVPPPLQPHPSSTPFYTHTALSHTRTLLHTPLPIKPCTHTHTHKPTHPQTPTLPLPNTPCPQLSGLVDSLRSEVASLAAARAAVVARGEGAQGAGAPAPPKDPKAVAAGEGEGGSQDIICVWGHPHFRVTA